MREQVVAQIGKAMAPLLLMSLLDVISGQIETAGDRSQGEPGGMTSTNIDANAVTPSCDDLTNLPHVCAKAWSVAQWEAHLCPIFCKWDEHKYDAICRRKCGKVRVPPKSYCKAKLVQGCERYWDAHEWNSFLCVYCRWHPQLKKFQSKQGATYSCKHACVPGSLAYRVANAWKWRKKQNQLVQLSNQFHGIKANEMPVHISQADVHALRLEVHSMLATDKVASKGGDDDDDNVLKTASPSPSPTPAPTPPTPAPPTPVPTPPTPAPLTKMQIYLRDKVLPEVQPAGGFGSIYGYIAGCFMSRIIGMPWMQYEMVRCTSYIDDINGRHNHALSCPINLPNHLEQAIRRCCNGLESPGQVHAQRVCKANVLTAVGPVLMHFKPQYDKCTSCDPDTTCSCAAKSSKSGMKMMHCLAAARKMWPNDVQCGTMWEKNIGSTIAGMLTATHAVLAHASWESDMSPAMRDILQQCAGGGSSMVCVLSLLRHDGHTADAARGWLEANHVHVLPPAEALHELAHAPGGHAGRIMRMSGRHIRYNDGGKATNPVDPYDLYDYKLQEDDDKPDAHVIAPLAKQGKTQHRVVAASQEQDNDEDNKILGQLRKQYRATHHSRVAVAAVADSTLHMPTPKPAVATNSHRHTSNHAATSSAAVLDDDYDDVPVH